MSTRVFLVRHGATELAAEDRFAGTIEVLLSDLGREQVRRLSRRLAPLELAAVYASSLGRTMETARILAEPCGLPVIPRDGLREISHGHWEGMIRAEVERKYREEYAHWVRDPYTIAPAGGGTALAVTARALPALLEIVTAHSDQHVLVVSHKATARLLVSALLGLDPRLYRDHLDQSPGALNIIDFKDSVHARTRAPGRSGQCRGRRDCSRASDRRDRGSAHYKIAALDAARSAHTRRRHAVHRRRTRRCARAGDDALSGDASPHNGERFF